MRVVIRNQVNVQICTTHISTVHIYQTEKLVARLGTPLKAADHAADDRGTACLLHTAHICTDVSTL